LPCEEIAVDTPSLDKPQKFTVSHLDEREFNTGGLRSYSAYRDLGIADATNGFATAHVIRMIAPFDAKSSELHHHNVTFQLVYVLKGWFKNEFEGEGVHVMREGSCWIQPPGIRHTVLGWSDDCELLEIILPAEHETVSDKA
jgi:mannose-6-phosphate isomerase-like protein (cupin superfamily)